MNKLLLSKNGRNHIKVMILKNCIETPTDEAEQINLSHKLFDELQHSEEAIKHSYYCNRKTGILTAIYELNNLIYLVNCFRTFTRGFYVCTLYIMPKDNLEDAKAIEKFFKANIAQIAEDYKNQIIEGKDAYEEFINKGAETADA